MTPDLATEWFLSIQLVMSQSADYLDLKRYVEKENFVKVTGKSMFRNLGEMIDDENKKLQDEEEAEEQLKWE